MRWSVREQQPVFSRAGLSGKSDGASAPGWADRDGVPGRPGLPQPGRKPGAKPKNLGGTFPVGEKPRESRFDLPSTDSVIPCRLYAAGSGKRKTVAGRKLAGVNWGAFEK
ncbi:MAG: hypothetical protein Ct9H300mP1_02980 [Planctomycetaceae bacterium]|nr:MAG: hypothetical protein Ct9H300mP1_02980 [Planctomycetaceae bacterium]